MIFEKTSLNGAFLIHLDNHVDNRGMFVRNFCKNEFKRNNINPFEIVQTSISHNQYKNTLRGMHYQTLPYRETKLIHCVKGKIYDVIIDLRADSSTYEKWYGVKLDYRKSLYIPDGFAHGFLTLDDDTIVIYYMNEFYEPDYERVFRWDSPKYNIKWINSENIIMSEKDKNSRIIYDKVISEMMDESNHLQCD